MSDEANHSQLMVEQMAADDRPVPLAYELLAKYGRTFDRRARFLGRRGTPGLCFANAADLATARGLSYCEGYAVNGNLLVPLAHAWCVDAEDTVYDPTWDNGGHYFGVQVHLARLQEFHRITGRHSLLQCLYLLRKTPDEVRELLRDAIVGAR